MLTFLQIRQPLAMQRLTGITVALAVATLGAFCAQCDEEDTTLFSNLFICVSPLQLYSAPYPFIFSDATLD